MPKHVKPACAAAVDAYLAALAAPDRAALQQLRAWIQNAAPHATEVFAYKMPAYTLGDSFLCAFACQKHYLCFYACNPEIIARHAHALAHLKIGKACIRFRHMEELPFATLQAIIQAGVTQLEEPSPIRTR